MKRIKALLAAAVLSCLILVGYFTIYQQRMERKYDRFHVRNNSIRYNIDYSKYKSHDALSMNIDDNTILLMGSSELTSGISFEENFRYLLDYEDKHIMQIGGGYFQSLNHAITLASLGHDRDDIKRVNLILSMQWFTQEGIRPEAFMQRLSIDHLNHLYQNTNISPETKTKLYQRVLELAEGNDVVKNHVTRLKNDFLWDRWINHWYCYKYRHLQNNEFWDDYSAAGIDESVNTKKFTGIFNWTEMEKKAIEAAKNESSNNDFYINQEYFDTYIREELPGYKAYAAATTFANSPEYDDLQLFLDVAKEQGIQVNLILVPLQGYWADYTGVPHSEIEGFYQRIRTLAADRGVNLIDHSRYSYEKYYFQDIMHLGRLGLLRLQRDLLEHNP